MTTGKNTVCWLSRQGAIEERIPDVVKSFRCSAQEARSKGECYSRIGTCIAAATVTSATCEEKLGQCDKSTTCCFNKEKAAVYDDYNKKTAEFEDK
jgi:hypothetical protein